MQRGAHTRERLDTLGPAHTSRGRDWDVYSDYHTSLPRSERQQEGCLVPNERAEGFGQGPSRVVKKDIREGLMTGLEPDLARVSRVGDSYQTPHVKETQHFAQAPGRSTETLPCARTSGTETWQSTARTPRSTEIHIPEMDGETQ
eukprot:GHVR01067922.1.p1 GENE.GHVR01067922.1~~GHVR01067922.1.p1  ORF type:complete len:145 (+),score=18.43 GHVR01067922.1:220-654(+)